ncbi:MAG: replicative DNA helicase [Balneola sp.]
MAKKNGSSYSKNSDFDQKKVLEQEGRIPPQAVEVEEAVLGAMLIEHGAATIALNMLKPEDFYKPANKHIYETLSNLYERDNPLDLLTVENELRDKGLLDNVGGPTYLSDLTRSVSSAANIEYHAQIITEKAIKRNLILASTDVIKEAYDTTTDAYDVLDEAEQKIFDLANQKNRSTAKPVADILKDTLAYLEDMRGKKYGITGVPSGLAVDQMTAGWQNGDLVIIAARPSMGKTAFVLTAARNAAMHPDDNLRTPVAIFSLEMSNQSLVQRLLTMEARVRADEARKGTLNDESFKDLIEAAGRLFTADLFIDDTPAITLMELRTKCRRLKTEHDIGLVIVDYLQLMQGSAKDSGNREQEIASISRGLKSLAKELDVPVIALSQLSRAVEQRGGDKRPQLSDLRESGSIEQDADVVMFLYRPEYYGITTTAEGQSTAGLAEVIIGKQRNGPVGSKMHYFVKDYARFENLTSQANDPAMIGGVSNDMLEANFTPQQDSPILPHNPAPDDEDAPF